MNLEISDKTMKNATYKALVVEETSNKVFTKHINDVAIKDLPAGDVLVRVKYSSLNYKDALSANGNRAVTKNYPHVPGIDAAGIVEQSAKADFHEGEQVIVTSYDLGMNTSGGFGQYIRVPASWVVKRPPSLSMKESMIFGTAGFTAGLSVHKLTATIKPEHGEILVTGATGGVGCIAVGILSKLGYSVTAVSGKADAGGLLKTLGVKEIISRQAFLEAILTNPSSLQFCLSAVLLESSQSHPVIQLKKFLYEYCPKRQTSNQSQALPKSVLVLSYRSFVNQSPQASPPSK